VVSFAEASLFSSSAAPVAAAQTSVGHARVSLQDSAACWRNTGAETPLSPSTVPASP